MKKAIAIIILGLLWCGTANAECKGNCVNGKGTQTFPNGYKYVGEWKNEKRHGQGTETWLSGEKWVGEFGNDLRLRSTSEYVFYDNPAVAESDDPDILTKEDPTTFQNIVFVKEKKIKGWDARTVKEMCTAKRLKLTNVCSGWKESLFKVFIFKATFEKGREINIRVNTEFETKDKAEEQALKYGKMVGQLPNFLKKKIKTITVHKGARVWSAGGYYDIVIHTEDQLPYLVLHTDGSSSDWKSTEEETLIHEAGHVSLDWAQRISKKYKWKKAAKADNKFISKYAKDFPKTEDVVETIIWWVGVRCKTDRISESNYKKILEAIPNRLKYLDEQNYDTYPMVCN